MLNPRIVNQAPNAFISSYQTGHAGENTTITPGMPVGLLLALTYAQTILNATHPYVSERPNIRISNEITHPRAVTI